MSGGPAVLGLGANLGDRLANLRTGVRTLCGLLRVTAVSPVYETEPVGGPAQPRYLNAVLLADPAAPAVLLAAARAAEQAAGRVRGERWGPRTLDVDVVAVGRLVHTDPELTVPHPRAHQRAFVLAPWADLAPDAVLPGHGPVAGLLARVGRAGVARRDDLALDR